MNASDVHERLLWQEKDFLTVSCKQVQTDYEHEVQSKEQSDVLGRVKEMNAKTWAWPANHAVWILLLPSLYEYIYDQQQNTNSHIMSGGLVGSCDIIT